MKRLVIATLLLSSTANAQVVECPKLFPSGNLTLSDVGLGEKEAARVQRGRLTYAYMYFGELYGEQYLTPPASKKVKGGWDAKYNFTPEHENWLACRYGGDEWGGGNVELWRKLDAKIRSCVLEVRAIREQSTSTAWTATASCK